MNKMETLVWTKEHRKSIIQEILSGHHPVQDSPTCIFMAGLPGSGKTEFTKRFIEASGIDFVRIDMDEIASKIIGYTPEKHEVSQRQK